MTPDEMKYIAEKSDQGAVRLLQSAIEDDNPIWRNMMQLGWASYLRESWVPRRFEYQIERNFLDALNRAKTPETGAQALRMFFEGQSDKEVTRALTRAGDDISPLMRWASAPVRWGRHEDHPHMMKVADRLVEQAVELGCDLNASAAVTVSKALNNKQRADHTALSYLIVEGSLIVGNPGADGPGATGQKADLLENAASLIRHGAKVGPREAAALTQMASPEAVVCWVSHFEHLGACTGQEILSLSTRLKKDPAALAAIQALSAKSVMSQIAKRHLPSSPQ